MTPYSAQQFLMVTQAGTFLAKCTIANRRLKIQEMTCAKAKQMLESWLEIDLVNLDGMVSPYIKVKELSS